MTVLEGIQRSTEFLAKKGLESPRLDAELLLAHVLRLKRMELYLNFERALSETETGNYRELIRRRSTREPLQHILGSVSFCGYEIKVSKSVLIPRPETELLAEAAWKFVSSRVESHPAVLDFGTGSGCIAIAIASHCPNARLSAIDCSNDALEVAKENALSNGVDQRIQFFHTDGFAAVRNAISFDLIVGNPPYIAANEIPTLQTEVRDFDPHCALDGGVDGLDFYRRLASEASVFLKPGARVMLEFGEGQAEAIENIFKSQNWVVEAITQDYTRRPRFITVKRQD
jgi:release factor glutamine methyltransferase